MLEAITGDCLEVMPQLIERGVMVDACIADVPYGTSQCAWDAVIPFEPMWSNLKKLVKVDGAIVLFSAQPFTSALLMSNAEMFCHEIVWEKNKHSNFLNAKRQPLQVHENVLVFCQGTPTYNPQPRLLTAAGTARNRRGKTLTAYRERDGYGDVTGLAEVSYAGKTHGYPRSVVKFNLESNNQFRRQVFHPTQKPVELLRYLVRTYTKPNDLVLDFTAGVCTTGVACAFEGRGFVGIEKEAAYCEIGRARLAAQ